MNSPHVPLQLNLVVVGVANQRSTFRFHFFSFARSMFSSLSLLDVSPQKAQQVLAVWATINALLSGAPRHVASLVIFLFFPFLIYPVFEGLPSFRTNGTNAFALTYFPTKSSLASQYSPSGPGANFTQIRIDNGYVV
jgi:hypothetical protein